MPVSALCLSLLFSLLESFFKVGSKSLVVRTLYSPPRLNTTKLGRQSNELGFARTRTRVYLKSANRKEYNSLENQI